MSINNSSIKIIKYPDDTIILGLISDNSELDYRNAIEYVADWCDTNFLALNVTKTGTGV